MLNHKTFAVLAPQPGQQTQFLKTSADIAIYGGGAGGGKTYGMLLDPLRHVHRKGFSAMFFRRTTKQIKQLGGLWENAGAMYRPLGGKSNETDLTFSWPQSTIKFAHLEHEKNMYDHQGGQYAGIYFDELTHFTEAQFWYLISRNRTVCGVKPYVRGTCNPDPDSWAAKFVEWYLDEQGYADREKSGVLRWFVREGDKLHWANTKKELGRMARSFTFIPSLLTDNKRLMDADSTYEITLAGLPRVERERLEKGNWHVRPQAGDYFRETDFRVVDANSAPIVRKVRHWDLAATEVSETNKDPDWTVGLLLGFYADKRCIVLDVIRKRWRAGAVEDLIEETAKLDTRQVKLSVPIDPGQAGVAQNDGLVKRMAKLNIKLHSVRETGDKVTRAVPAAVAAQRGMIEVLKAPWNRAFFDELGLFPKDGENIHKDQVDALANAYNLGVQGSTLLSFFEA